MFFHQLVIFPWQCLNFFPLPHQQASFLPIFWGFLIGICLLSDALVPCCCASNSSDTPLSNSPCLYLSFDSSSISEGTSCCDPCTARTSTFSSRLITVFQISSCSASKSILP